MIVFTIDIVVDGVQFRAGDRVEESRVPPGSLESLLRCKQAERVVEAKPLPKKPDKA